MKFSRSLIVVLLLILFLVLFKVFFLKKETPPAQQGAQGKTQKFPVTIKVIQSSDLENKIKATGSLLSNEEIMIIAEVPGILEKIYFKEGSHVRKGQPLIKINDADLQAQLKKLGFQEKLAAGKEERQKKLLEINGISKEEYDMTMNNLNTIQADIEFTRSQLMKTSIYAPFDGVIGLKNLSEGNLVNPSMKIASLQQTDPIKIDFSIPEKYATRVKVNDKITFKVEGNDSTFTGSIFAIEPRIDAVTRTLPVRAVCSNKSGKLFPGSFARIELTMEKTDDAILIPTQAIIPELKGQKVFICKYGKAEPVMVQTGLRTDTEVEITEGLKAGDSLVVSGFMQLRPGVDLKIGMEKQ